MQIQAGTIVSETAPRVKTAATLYKKTSDDRINGSIPVWQSAADRKKGDILLAQSETKITQTKVDSFANLVQKPSPATVQNPAPVSVTVTPAGKDASFGFLDLVDMVNPLQHIPVVSTIYRTITGDTIRPVSKVIGGAAFGGFLGAASGLVDAIVQTVSGEDIGQHVSADFAALGSSDQKSANATAAFASLKRSSFNA